MGFIKLSGITDSQTGYTVQHLLLAISAAFLLNEWELALLISPWLILQGSYLFFIHKHSKFMAKLALAFIFFGLLKLGFIDTTNILLWQKVALMIGIGIGIFMLGPRLFIKNGFHKQLYTTNNTIGDWITEN
ncbi:MAG: hypothetical protein ACI9LX_004146 [Paraglaciecola sp.]